MKTGKIKYSGEPVYIFDADARDRSDYVVYIIADGEEATCYPCNKNSLIFDNEFNESAIREKLDRETK